MRFVGVDPGLDGGLALLSHDAQRVMTWAMPVLVLPNSGKGRPGRREVDLRELARIVVDMLTSYDDKTIVTIELVQASPQMGRGSAFNFGRSSMAVEAIFNFHAWESDNVTINLVRPATWKVRMGVTASKETSVSKASEMWPRDARKHFYGPRGAGKDGRAEAALLADYGRIIHAQKELRAELKRA